MLSANKLLILGDSLSAGYQLPAERNWPTLLAQQWQKTEPAIEIVNASISGDTTTQGLNRLPALLRQHKPRWVLIELGANDGLRGFSLLDIERNLAKTITTAQHAKALVILMQIKIPPNYGKRYSEAFSALYPRLAAAHNIALLPFYIEDVISQANWMLPDGIHPNVKAQPFIADWMTKRLKPLLME